MQYLQDTAQRLVVKIGTNSLTERDGTLIPGRLENFARQIDELKKRKLQVIVVSSGAVGLGMRRLSLEKRPSDLPSLQACAAIGQGILIEAWRKAFAPYEREVAQILLTREDVRPRKRNLAVNHTLDRLLHFGIIPIINENDTVSTAEIRFGDNDVLSALTAIMLKADLLVILSTIRGLLDRDKGDLLIPFVEKITPEILALAGGTDSPTATGGMTTKLEAARITTTSGCGCFIGSGQAENILPEILSSQAEGTFFLPSKITIASKKRWIAHFAKTEGSLTIDPGATKALRETGSSLLAKGVCSFDGIFDKDSVVLIKDREGVPIGRGIVQFGHEDMAKILGCSNKDVLLHFPGRKRGEVVHRDSFVLL